MKEKLYNLLLNDYGKNIALCIFSGFVDRCVSLRVNTLKTSVSYVKDCFLKENISFSTVPWSSDALIILNVDEGVLRGLSLYKEGFIYLQSLSSMIPPLVLRPYEGESILDMAAAPGGKTTQMANLSNNKAMIMALEKNKIRAERLKYNVEKQGCKRVSVVVGDGIKLDDYFSFDKVLLDAPCSGSGTIGSCFPSSFSDSLIERSIDLQKKLLVSALNHVKKGGVVVYSTCSILKCENEDVINYVLDRFDVSVEMIDGFEDVPLLPTSIPGTICVLPSRFYEGFFVCKLRKK